jgi:hypothetical protein
VNPGLPASAADRPCSRSTAGARATPSTVPLEFVGTPISSTSRGTIRFTLQPAGAAMASQPADAPASNPLSAPSSPEISRTHSTRQLRRRDHMLLDSPGFAGESWHNQVHDVVSGVAYGAMLAAPLVLARRWRDDRTGCL